MSPPPGATELTRGAPDSASRLPTPRGVTPIIGVIGVVVLATGIRGAAGIVAPTMLALVLTIAVLPLRSWAQRHGWPSWLATLFALVASYAILLVLVIGTVVCLVKLVDLLPQYASDADNLTGNAQDWLSDAGVGGATTSDILQKVDLTKVADLFDRHPLVDAGRPRRRCSSW